MVKECVEKHATRSSFGESRPAANFEVELLFDIVYSLLISWSMWLVAARVKI